MIINFDRFIQTNSCQNLSKVQFPRFHPCHKLFEIVKVYLICISVCQWSNSKMKKSLLKFIDKKYNAKNNKLTIFYYTKLHSNHFHSWTETQRPGQTMRVIGQLFFLHQVISDLAQINKNSRSNQREQTKTETHVRIVRNSFFLFFKVLSFKFFRVFWTFGQLLGPFLNGYKIIWKKMFFLTILYQNRS